MSKKKRVEEKKITPDLSKQLYHAVEWYNNPLYAQFLIVILALLFYCNTIFNEYALDDVISITMNSFTKKGFGGIADILCKDSFYGFIGSASQLSGGRWRPFTLVTYAIEWQFFGQSPHISHFINVLLYVLLCVMIFRFLFKYLLKGNVLMSLIATLLFCIHPIHTEVVANIKSRDEIFSLLFLMLTLSYAMKYFYESKKVSALILSLMFYFLALLSKENGLTFIAIIPLTFYFVSDNSIISILKKSIPFVGVAVLYILLRISVIGFVHKEGKDAIDEVMNAPYLYATAMQAFATKILVLMYYIKLLLFPYPLSYDYSFHQIPYVSISNIGFLFSVAVHLSLFVYAILNLKKKNLNAYGILFYFLSIFIVSNLLVDTGGVMGERFLFQPSLGFSVAITALVFVLWKKFALPENKTIISAVMILLIMICGYETISRNMDWKSDKVLFIKDVKAAPNSARTQNGAGTAFILLTDAIKDSIQKKTLLDSAVYHLNKALEIHPKYIDPWLNLGVVYNREGDLYKAEEMWNKARQRNATHPKLKEYDGVLSGMFVNTGLKEGTKKNYPASITLFNKALIYNKDNVDAWYNLGGAYYSTQKIDSASYAWTECLKRKPDYTQAQQGMKAINAMQNH